MKNFFFYLKLALLIGIFVWIFKSVNISESIKVLTKTNLFYFFLAFLLNNLSNFLLTIKWLRLANPLGIKSNYFELLKLNYISMFYSIFVPGQASGELIKGLKLSKKEGFEQKVWVPIFIDKATNLLIMLIIGFVAILLDKTFRNNLSLIIPVSIITMAFFVLTIILFSEKTVPVVKSFKDLLVNFLNLFKIKFKALEDFSINYFESYKKHDHLMIETLLWSIAIKLPHIMVYFLLAQSLNINLNIIQSAWLFSIVSILSLLPISFSGLGVREGTVVVLLSNPGIQNHLALSFSLLVFISGLLPGLIGGLIELFSTIKDARSK